MDVLEKLSPELRTKIWEYVLSADVLCLRRPTTPTSISSTTATTALLACCKYIYLETVNIFYSTHAFQLTLHDLKSWSNAQDYCKIRRITLLRNRDYDEDGEVGIRTLASNFMQESKNIAARTPDRKLSLHHVTIEERNISHEYVDVMRHSTVGGTVKDVDVGLWSIKLGQSYSIRLEHTLLRPLWVKAVSELNTWYSHQDHAALPPVHRDGGMSHACADFVVKDIIRTVGERYRSLGFRSVPGYMADSLGDLILEERGRTWLAEHEFHEVSAVCERKVIEWANDVLLVGLLFCNHWYGYDDSDVED